MEIALVVLGACLVWCTYLIVNNSVDINLNIKKTIKVDKSSEPSAEAELMSEEVRKKLEKLTAEPRVSIDDALKKLNEYMTATEVDGDAK